MARRKRKDDTPAWVAPDFDEVGFMRREIEGARAAVATIAWAVVGALVGFALYSVLPVLAFFGGIAVGFGMYFIFPLLGFKTESFKRRDWIVGGTWSLNGGFRRMIQNASQLKKYVIPWPIQSRRLKDSVLNPRRGKMKYIPNPTATPPKNARTGRTE